MEKEGRSDSQQDVAHFEEVKFAMKNQPSYTSEEDNRPRNGENDIDLSHGVEIDNRTPVTTLRADVDHFGLTTDENQLESKMLSSMGIVERNGGQQTNYIPCLRVSYLRGGASERRSNQSNR